MAMGRNLGSGVRRGRAVVLNPDEPKVAVGFSPSVDRPQRPL
jgi:hypothetical protein